MSKTVSVSTVARPYTLTFLATGTSYPLGSEDAQRLLDEYPVVSATGQRVVLPGHNTSNPRERCVLQPATRGGGVAFVVVTDELRVSSRRGVRRLRYPR